MCAPFGTILILPMGGMWGTIGMFIEERVSGIGGATWKSVVCRLVKAGCRGLLAVDLRRRGWWSMADGAYTTGFFFVCRK
jgi:hypothetical protein